METKRHKEIEKQMQEIARIGGYKKVFREHLEYANDRGLKINSKEDRGTIAEIAATHLNEIVDKAIKETTTVALDSANNIFEEAARLEVALEHAVKVIELYQTEIKNYGYDKQGLCQHPYFTKAIEDIKALSTGGGSIKKNN